MGGWFGVSGARSRSRFPPLRSRIPAIGLPVAIALGSACTGEPLVVAEEGAGGPPEPVGVTTDAGSDARPPNVLSTEECPASPSDRQLMFGCWPPRHLGRFRGFFIGAPSYERLAGSSEEFPAGALELVIADDGTGQLRFGATDELLEREPCADLGSSRCASVGRLLTGFGYRLAELALFDPKDEPPLIEGEPPRRGAESLSFRVWLGEPWAAWCADQTLPKSNCRSAECVDTSEAPVSGSAEADRTSSCGCVEQECRPRATSLRFSLRMSKDNQAMRGVYTPEDERLADAHLELQRENEP